MDDFTCMLLRWLDRSRLEDELKLLVHLQLLGLLGQPVCRWSIPASSLRVSHMTHVDAEGKLMTWERRRRDSIASWRLGVVAIRQDHIMSKHTHTSCGDERYQCAQNKPRSHPCVMPGMIKRKRITKLVHKTNSMKENSQSVQLGCPKLTDQLEDRGRCPSWTGPTAGSLWHSPKKRGRVRKPKQTTAGRAETWQRILFLLTLHVLFVFTQPQGFYKNMRKQCTEPLCHFCHQMPKVSKTKQVNCKHDSLVLIRAAVLQCCALCYQSTPMTLS